MASVTSLVGKVKMCFPGGKFFPSVARDPHFSKQGKQATTRRLYFYVKYLVLETLTTIGTLKR